MKKVVIIGGGFAGSLAAKKLEKKFEVTLVDTKNFFEFTPGILRTIVEPKHISKIQVMHEHYLKHAKVLVGEVTEVGSNYVKIKSKRVPFDYLIISSGSSYFVPFKAQNVILADRAERLRKYSNELKKAKRVLIIGGGLVGVELAGEIIWRYKKEKEITIINASPKIIERNSDKAISYADNFLKNNNAKIINNEYVTKIQGKTLITNKKNKYEADIIFLCKGILPNYKFMEKNFSSKLNDLKQIRVNKFLQIEDHENIFSAGDLSSIAQEKTAQNSELQAKVVVRNIIAMENSSNLKEFTPKKTAMVISLGKNKGILAAKNFTITGFLPGVMKGIIEKKEMWKKRKFN